MGKAAVIYWSGTGNTEAMANAIADGMKQGGAETEVFAVPGAPTDLSSYERVAFGCPSMGDEVLEEMDFAPYFESIENNLNGKRVALFGSYGWGDGQWMRDWASRTNDAGANMMDDGFPVQESSRDEAECVAYGKQFAAF